MTRGALSSGHARGRRRERAASVASARPESRARGQRRERAASVASARPASRARGQRRDRAAECEYRKQGVS
jgi:hypothetical protein